MDLPASKKTELGLYLTAIEAYDFIKAHEQEVLFIDVRTRAEVTFIGMPTLVDANIPYKDERNWQNWDEKGKTYELVVNNDFVTAVNQRLQEKALTKQSPVILMCRSGIRSAEATNVLNKAGYTTVYNLVDGFEGDSNAKGQRVVNGWKNSQLPWSFDLDKQKMYWR
jgi:rhodanese-related sulfurtransferase